jgi:uncharacterized protein (DUF1778 family)
MPRLQTTNRRSRVINFRVTEKEYDAVHAACRVEGDQNLSEFARRATIDFARSRIAAADGLQNQLDTLGQKLSRVDSVLGELVSTLKPARTTR